MKTLLDNKWVSVVENGEGYVYTTYPWSNSKGVAILPYRHGTKEKKLSFLGRYEVTPAHSDKPELGAIQGGYDNPEITIPQTAIKELLEEGGYEVQESNLISLGSVWNSKASDNVTYLFAVHINTTIEVQQELSGDGTKFEIGAWSSWVTPDEAINCKDPLMSVMITRLALKVPDVGVIR